MKTLHFTEDHYDALGEVCNLAMGQAGAALANLLGVFVCLQSPRVQVLAAEEVMAHLGTVDEADQPVVAVRQSFHGDVTGEVIALHIGGRPGDIHDLLGYESQPSREEEREIIFDLSNVLNGAVINGIWKQFGAEVGFSPPTLFQEGVALRNLDLSPSRAGSHVLIVEVHFRLEEREFAVRELIFLPDESFAFVQSALDHFLENLG